MGVIIAKEINKYYLQSIILWYYCSSNLISKLEKTVEARLNEARNVALNEAGNEAHELFGILEDVSAYAGRENVCKHKNEERRVKAAGMAVSAHTGDGEYVSRVGTPVSLQT